MTLGTLSDGQSMKVKSHYVNVEHLKGIIVEHIVSHDRSTVIVRNASDMQEQLEFATLQTEWLRGEGQPMHEPVTTNFYSRGDVILWKPRAQEPGGPLREDMVLEACGETLLLGSRIDPQRQRTTGGTWWALEDMDIKHVKAPGEATGPLETKAEVRE